MNIVRWVLLILVMFFSYASEWKPTAELNFRWGFSNQSAILSPLLTWEHSYVNLAGKLSKDSTVVVRWALPDTTTASFRPNDLFYEAYYQEAESKFGKHHAPFGSYMTRTISDVWSRSFEEVNRIGLSTRFTFTDVIALKVGAFNNGVNDALSGFALKTEIIPRPDIMFEQSFLYDQVFDTNGARVDKLDVHAMSMLDFKGALVDIDLYRQLAGPNMNATVVNVGLQVQLTKPLDLAMRLEWANAGAAALINRNVGVTIGLNNKLSPVSTYSIEGQFMTLQDSQFSWVLQNRLSVSL